MPAPQCKFEIILARYTSFMNKLKIIDDTFTQYKGLDWEMKRPVTNMAA